MKSRREFLKEAVIAASGACAALATAGALPGISVLTFDTYLTTYTAAFPIMKARGIVGTFFVDFDRLDAPGCPTAWQLKEMQDRGWEVGAYSGVNLTKIPLSEARERIMTIKRTAEAKGFDVTSLAPMQRAWSPALRDAARGVFRAVRIADLINEPLLTPPKDRLYVRRGSTASLSVDDTAASLCKGIRAINGIGIRVIHQVGNDADPLYSVSIPAFTAMCDEIKRRMDIGLLVSRTFGDAV